MWGGPLEVGVEKTDKVEKKIPSIEEIEPKGTLLIGAKKYRFWGLIHLVV